VPWLDIRKEALVSEGAYRYIAGPALRPALRAALRDFRARPVSIFIECVEMYTKEGADENCVAAVVVPIRDENPVDYAFFSIAEDFSFPLAGPVIDQRNMSLVLRRASVAAVSGRLLILPAHCRQYRPSADDGTWEAGRSR
jgi:hypothetical protein